MQNITAQYPTELYSGKTYIEEEGFLTEKHGETKRVAFSEIQKISVQPIRWLPLFNITNDVVLILFSGEEKRLENLTQAGITAIRKEIISSYPRVQIVTEKTLLNSTPILGLRVGAPIIVPKSVAFGLPLLLILPVIVVLVFAFMRAHGI